MGLVWKRGATLEKGPPKIGWREALGAPYLTEPTTLLLICANLLPLLGVLFWDWDLLLLMLLYWMESAVIGFWHILRLGIEARWFALFLVPFFTVHFGGFMTGHFVFIGALFGGPQWAHIRSVDGFFEELVLPTGLWIPLLALFVSHGVSFLLNYAGALSRSPSAKGSQSTPWARIIEIAIQRQKILVQLKKEGKIPSTDDPSVKKETEEIRASIQPFTEMMVGPYRRIVVMHLTIIFGGMLSMALHSHQAAFILMVILKIGADIGSHVRKNFVPAPQATKETP